MPVLYALLLEDQRWYIGKTDNMDQRWADHLAGSGAQWTRVYRPLKVYETRPCGINTFEEDHMLKEYMRRYGVHRVRGGSYTRIHLDHEEIRILTREIRSSTDACWKCGVSGHVSTVCPDLDYGDDSSDDNSSLEDGADSDHKDYPNDTCYRCGREGHWASRCYARYDVCGRRLQL